MRASVETPKKDARTSKNAPRHLGKNDELAAIDPHIVNVFLECLSIPFIYVNETVTKSS